LPAALIADFKVPNEVPKATILSVTDALPDVRVFKVSTTVP